MINVKRWRSCATYIFSIVLFVFATPHSAEHATHRRGHGFTYTWGVHRALCTIDGRSESNFIKNIEQEEKDIVSLIPIVLLLHPVPCLIGGSNVSDPVLHARPQHAANRPEVRPQERTLLPP